MHRVYCIVRLIALLCVAKALPIHAEQPVSDARHPVWVMGNGFHSAYVLFTRDAGPLLRSSVRDPQAKWVVVGWGDRDFFMAKRYNLWITIKAVCWPTPSALHVIPLRKTPEAVYRNSDIIRLQLAPDRLAKLRDYMESQFATDRQGNLFFWGQASQSGAVSFLEMRPSTFPRCAITGWLEDSNERGCQFHR